jgi:RNA polymerase sigma factor (TIGR02999 family)
LSTPHQLISLLRRSSGDKAALDELMPLLYDELRRLANSYLRRESSGQTLQPTALVHEVYLRLVSQHQLMRQILVDRARAHRSAKRGGAARNISLDDTVSFARERGADLLALDEALDGLAAIDPRKCKVIELRFFGGLDVDETGRMLNISAATVGRELRVAKAWLYREMKK